eukprot:80395-Lingulodinium_polyedra.AAC.1
MPGACPAGAPGHEEAGCSCRVGRQARLALRLTPGTCPEGVPGHARLTGAPTRHSANLTPG